MSYEILAANILNGLEKIGEPFRVSQIETGLNCPPECGKCCLNADVACHPYELLPLALDLYDRGLAEKYLEMAKSEEGNVCILLKILNIENGKAQCSEYQFRPSVCRSFGVSKIIIKNKREDFSICKHLKEGINLENISLKNLPVLGHVKKQVEAIHPELLGPNYQINTALKMILEKVLNYKYYKNL